MLIVNPYIKELLKTLLFSVVLCCTFTLSEAQCEKIDTSQQIYDAHINRWLGNLEKDIDLAVSNVDTLSCLSIKKENWNNLFIIYLNTISESTNNGKYHHSLALLSRLENDFVKNYIHSFSLDWKNRILIQLASHKAHLYYLLGNYKLAENICRVSIRRLDTMTLNQGTKNLFFNAFHSHIGGIANKLGNYDDALGYYRLAEENISNSGKKGNNWTKKLIGDVHLNKGAFDNALGNYFEVLDYNYSLVETNQFKELDERIKITNRIVNTIIKISIIYQNKNVHDSTFTYINEGLTIHNKYANSPPIAILHQYGVALTQFGQLELALETLQNVLKLKKDVYKAYHPELAETYLAIGKVYESYDNSQLENASKNYQLAIESILKNYQGDKGIRSIPTAKQIDQSTFKKILSEALYRSGIILEKLSSLKNKENLKLLQNASETIFSALYTIEKTRTSFHSENDKQYLQEESYKIFEAAIRISEKLYQLTGEKQYRNYAFEVAEKSKSIILYDAIKNAGALNFANISAKKLTEERDLRLQLTALEKELQTEGKDEAYQQNLESQIFETKQVIKKFTQQLEAENPVYYELKYKPNALTLATIQEELLDDKETLIEYFIGDEQIYVFLVKSTGIPELVTIPLKNRADLNQLIDDYRTSIFSNQEEAKQQQLAKQLYQQIFAPLEDKNLGGHLLIIPDGKLGSIPFDALICADSYEKDESIPFYLGLKYTFSYNYSATLLNEMKQRSLKPTKEGVLGLAPSFPNEGVKIAGGNYNKLPLNDDEVHQLTSIWGGQALIGKAANRQNFLQEAPAYPFLHLSTHGVVNNDQPRFSFVSFAQTDKEVNQEELLYVSDLFNMNLNAEMVTLSACETGIGKAYRGEGIISLARGFAYAGTKSILPTLWAVNEQTTVKLMTRFYEQLKTGKDKATALRLAKEELILKDKLPPYYWAGVIAIGDMSPIASTNILLWASLALLFISLLYFLYLKAKK